jgi:phenylacetic acid degradation protein PaaD
MSQVPLSVETLHGADGLGRLLGVRYVDGGDNFAVVELDIGAQHLNFLGGCHGGVIFALADSAFGLASNSMGNLSVAIDAHITFIKGVKPGDTIRAEARLVSNSSKTAVFRADVTREGQVLGTFTGTVFVTGKNVRDFVAAD